MRNEGQKNINISNMFYAVIGVATLMLAIVGATFAYYTASADNNNVINGTMSTIGFDVTVTKVLKQDESKGGLIPMSNNMVQAAMNSSKGICVDDNGNAVCQIYRITVVNNSTASLFVDGYVTLSGGSGVPADIPDGYSATSNTTSMRWAQVFCSGDTSNTVTGCSTAGNSTVRPDSGSVAIAALGGDSTKDKPENKEEILTSRSAIATEEAGYVTIQGYGYEVIDKNFIRLSNHTYGNYNYTRDNDPTSALVWNQFLEANDNVNNHTGNSNTTYTDAQVFYIVVWLSENGHNQTAGSGETNVPGKPGANFFQGNTTFISAQGNEVTATFTGSVRVTPNTPVSGS